MSHDLGAIRAAVEARAAQEEAEYGTGEDGHGKGEARTVLSLMDWRSDTAFTGPPPVREYLVDGVFPRGQASLLAASGGVGKSFSLLSAALDVARGRGRGVLPPRHFGGILRGGGTAVYLSAEDDSIELHTRLAALGGPHERLIAVPLPSAGGAPIMFRADPATREPSVTAAWEALTRQIKELPDLAVVILDPLQPLCALDLNAPEHAQYVCSQIAALASETGAAVILSHHFRKTDADSPEEARQAVRGSAGLVDGVRSVVAMWLKSEGGARDRTGGGAICKAIGEHYAPGRVVQAAVVKANGKARTGITTFLRGDTGLLQDVSERVRGIAGSSPELADMLTDAIAEAARQGRPYRRTGEASGLFARRHEIGEPFWVMPRRTIESMAGELLRDKRVVLAQHGKAKNILDVPDGPFARGEGVFVDGAKGVGE